MKIRIEIPEYIRGNTDRTTVWIDNILLWGMEVGMDIEFYGHYTLPNQNTWSDHRRWAVFSVEEQNSFMFILKWGATMHKDKKKNEL